MQEVLTAARVAVTVAFLVYASWSDYKTREVSNRVWVAYAPIGLALSLAELVLYESSQLWLFGLSVGMTVGFSLLLFYTGAFGGADSKALMCIGFTLPFFPATLFSPVLVGGTSPISEIIFPITVLSNSVLVAAASAIYLLSRNLARKASTGKPLFEGTLSKESLGKKILVLVTGQKFPLATLQAKWHVYPLEDIAEAETEAKEPIRKLIVVPRDEGREEVLKRLSDAAAKGQINSKIWATPGLPMLIFIAVGLIIALFFGDIIWALVSSMLG